MIFEHKNHEKRMPIHDLRKQFHLLVATVHEKDVLQIF